MIDWLYSKLAVLVASFIILGGLMGVLGAVNGSLRDLHAETIAQRIASVLDSIASVQGETEAVVTVAGPGEPGTVPRTIARESYFVRIYRDSVVIHRESRPQDPWRIAPLLQPVYASPPPADRELNGMELGALEAESRVDGLTVFPLRDIHVARALIVAAGQPRYLTFVYA